MSQDAGQPPEYQTPYLQNAPGVWPPPPTNQPDVSRGLLMPLFNFTDTLSRWVVGLLVMNIAFDVLGMVIDPVRSSTGQLVSALASGLQNLMFIVTGVVFFIWTYRSYKNLTTFGATGLRMTPGWVIVYFFVPILNLFRPYTAFKEIWQASTSKLPLGEGRAWKSAPTSRILLSWWLLWLVKIFADDFVAFSAQDGKAASVNVWLTEGDHIAGIAAAVCAIFVVRGITARQETRWQEIIAVQPTMGLPSTYPSSGNF
jgi:hypothetical protein